MTTEITHPQDPRKFEIDVCRSCAAPIIWAISARNVQRMPVDAEPSADGSVRLREREALPPLAEVLPVAKRFGLRNLRKAHFATCPQGRKWSSAGRSTRSREAS